MFLLVGQCFLCFDCSSGAVIDFHWFFRKGSCSLRTVFYSSEVLALLADTFLFLSSCCFRLQIRSCGCSHCYYYCLYCCSLGNRTAVTINAGIGFRGFLIGLRAIAGYSLIIASFEFFLRLFISLFLFH